IAHRVARRSPPPTPLPYPPLFRPALLPRLVAMLARLKTSRDNVPAFHHGPLFTGNPTRNRIRYRCTRPDTDRHPCPTGRGAIGRSEEHTSELQSRENLVCRLLLGK